MPFSVTNQTSRVLAHWMHHRISPQFLRKVRIAGWGVPGHRQVTLHYSGKAWLQGAVGMAEQSFLSGQAVRPKGQQQCGLPRLALWHCSVQDGYMEKSKETQQFQIANITDLTARRVHKSVV